MTDSALFSVRGETTRARLLDAAATALATSGYHGCSYAELIASSGLSKGAYYHYFPSKQDLAMAVYLDRQKKIIEASTEAVAEVASPLARLLGVLRVRAKLFATDQTLQCLPRLATDFATVPELSSQVAEGHRVPIELFRRLLEEARKAGEIRGDMDLDVVARVLFSALIGVNELSQRESRSRDHQDRTEELISVFEAALAPRQSRRKRNRWTSTRRQKGSAR